MIEKKDGLYDNGGIRVEDYNDGYYHVFQDCFEHPSYQIYLAYSRRGPGKTTSALLGSLLRGLKVLYLKREVQDVAAITNSTSALNMSPWSSVNKLTGSNFRAIRIKGQKNIAEVVNCDQDGNPIEGSEPVGWIFALCNAGKIKGFDISHLVDIIILDEFVPSSGTRVLQAEGIFLLDLIATVNRDRVDKGFSPTKIFLFSNCDSLGCPITRELNLLDELYELNASGNKFRENEERSIFIRHILSNEFKNNTNILLFKPMIGTDWYERNVIGNFTEDFSSIDSGRSLKNYKCVSKLIYKQKVVYILNRESDGSYYITYNYTLRVSKDIPIYNLDIESHVNRFFYSPVYMSLLGKMIYELVSFSNYSLYDLIRNYTTIYNKQMY